VRWLCPPAVLLACTAALVIIDQSWQPSEAGTRPEGRSAEYCGNLLKALPDTVAGHPRDRRVLPSYVAAWDSSRRTVLRCGVPRPGALRDLAKRRSENPNVNGVEWFMERDGHGGYRFTVTQRLTHVEVSVPAGAYPNYADPLAEISGAVRATIPDLSGALNTDTDTDGD
jgi:hypothetical protein